MSLGGLPRKTLYGGFKTGKETPESKNSFEAKTMKHLKVKSEGVKTSRLAFIWWPETQLALHLLSFEHRSLFHSQDVRIL